MEKLLYHSFLIVHVICGFTALTTGIVPMVAQKGGKVHNFWGKVYYWAMFGVFVTSTIFFFIYPTQFKYQFFLGIGILSFYQTYTGRRILSMKKELSPNRLDWLATYLMIGTGLMLTGFCVQNILKNQTSSAVLFGIFGVLSFTQGLNDLKMWSGKIAIEKMHWFFHHISRMMGSYAATTTAFCVNVVPRYLPSSTPSWAYLVSWILPGAVIGFFIGRWIKSYRIKFKLTPKESRIAKLVQRIKRDKILAGE